MAREFSRKFYKSKQWKDTRNAFARSKNNLCERCLRSGQVVRGEIVHHKQHLSPDNINDTSITLGFNNLELLCRDCHAAEHPEIYRNNRKAKPRVAFDENGNVIRLEVEGI